MQRELVVLTILSIKLLLCEVDDQNDGVLDVIKSAGYKGQRYEVATKDGYLLKVHRVFPKTGSSSKFPVFLMHGLFATSSEYILTGPKIALPYLLADNGYDVWLGNARGNNYSTNHKTLSTESGEFWNFSWHEIGYYDLPAMIDFMLNKTKSSKAFYVGHSQGSTSFLVLLSMRPEYNHKIAQAHLLAPAAFMKNEKYPEIFKTLGDEVAKGLLDVYGYLHFETFWDLGEKLSEFLCIQHQTKVCDELYFVTLGRNKNGIKVDSRTLRLILLSLTSRISVKQAKHYNQLIRSGNFQMFDYQRDNKKYYNSKSPPEYELKNVKAKVYLYSGLEDSVVIQFGVERLKGVLPNVQRHETIPDYNHGDFAFANNARKVLYQQILQSFESIKKKMK